MNKATGRDFQIEHSGKHHLAEISSKKGISKGRISAFSDRGVVSLALRRGKVSGEIIHSSDNHYASVLLKPNGTWEGKYSNKWNDKTLTLLTSKGKVRPSQANLSFAHNGPNHDFSIAVNQEGKFTGQIMRKGPNTELQIQARPGGRMSASVGHTGQHHNFSIALNRNGTWTAKGEVKTNGGTLRFSARKGEGKVGFSMPL